MKPQIAILSLIAAAGLIASLVAFSSWAATGTGTSIIPAPQKLERTRGNFTLSSRIKLVVDAPAKETGEYLAQKLRASTGFPLPISLEQNPDAENGSIVLTTHAARQNLGPEGYHLEVRPRSVLIRAPAPAGLFYGVQTLLQLFPSEIFSSEPVRSIKWSAPCLKIEDQPRFPWRGMLLDVARHFFTPDELKQVFDDLALHKINRCQLHLTDDQGWRVEIRKYERLTQVGGWRKSIGFNLDPKSSTAYGPDGRYGGFFSQDEIRDLVAYAEARHITLIPEVEMPGHASAALAAYPEYSCSGGPYTTDMSAGVFAGVFCAGNEATYTFLGDILREVGELFPGKYIHIGGDEVTKENWKGCARCQALMRREGLKTEEQLQSYFIHRIEGILNAQGRKMIGWSEIRQGGLAKSATLMDWIGGAVEGASAGHDVIMTPTTHCYLDYYQSRNRTNEPPGIGAFLPLKTVYSFEPVPAKLEPRLHSRILGTQGNVWTEYIPSLSHVEYMTFPRLCALAEVAWSSPESRHWGDFTRRLSVHCTRLDQLGIRYRSGFFEE